MECNFSLKHYEECMQLISLASNTCEILHDLDHPEDNILEIAELERIHQISAKYFIRIHAKNYNPFSLKNLQIYRKLVEMGHELGLHFEPGFYSENSITEAITKEAEALQFIVGVPIKYLSIHEPARFGSVNQASIPNSLLYYCWNSTYYTDKKYISDSSARWREGCMCEHIGKHEKLIILTHPIWWFKETSAENY
jgi:hypothetical protein